MTATYGDLVGQAGADIHAGLLRVMRRGFRDHAEAVNTVGAYYDLIAALRDHTHHLLHPAGGRPTDRAGDGRAPKDELMRVATGVFRAYGALDQRPTSMPYPHTAFDHPWREAAAKLGAAADLLATHLGPAGENRSEHAYLVLDPSARWAALGTVAELTAVMVHADTALGAACRHRDVPWDQVHKWLPDRQMTKSLMRRWQQLTGPLSEGPTLRDLTPNVYPVREGEPVTELTDRMLRLRHAAWNLADGHPDYSVVTLRDLAGLGMATHLHTAAAHGIRPGVAGAESHPLIAAARRFHQLAADLADYLAPGPPDGEIRADILAVRQLLHDLSPANRPPHELTVPDGRSRATIGALHGACEISSQMATSNQRTFTTLARSGQIHIPTRLLTGEVLSNDPATAQAKLTGALRVTAPSMRVRQTLECYQAVAASSHVDAYEPPRVRAGTYSPPALFRPSEFEGRP